MSRNSSCNDGTVNSDPDSVIITTINVAPVANAGPDQAGMAPVSLVTLNGSGSSDANGDPLTYSWSLTASRRQRRGPVESHQRIADLYSSTSPATMSWNSLSTMAPWAAHPTA